LFFHYWPAMRCAGVWQGRQTKLKTDTFGIYLGYVSGCKAGAMSIPLVGAKNLGAMKSAVLIVVVLCSAFGTVALAKDRPGKNHPWKDAKVIDITTEKGGAVVVPVTALLGSSPVTKTFYWIQTEDTIYVLGPVLTRSRLLNLTLHGPTKVTIVGNNAHILDDEEIDKKIAIAEKIARPKSEGPQ
jgi:hypothetical protein